jgi:hypothetical protein
MYSICGRPYYGGIIVTNSAHLEDTCIRITDINAYILVCVCVHINDINTVMGEFKSFANITSQVRC